MTIAFKAFDENMACRGFKYEVGKTYEHVGDVNICSRGFHACTIPFDAWRYYPGSKTLARVVYPDGTNGQTDSDSKVVGAKITIEAKLTLSEWVRAQAAAVLELCKTAVNTIASQDKECAVSTGDRGHAVSTGDHGHAASTGDRGHAVSGGDRGHAVSTEYRGHATSIGDRGYAVSTGYRGHAASIGDCGHAASIGEGGHAVSTGYNGHAVSTGGGGHAVSTGGGGHAAVKGKHAVASSLGYNGSAKAGADGWLVLGYWNYRYELIHVRSAKVGTNGIKANVTYKLNSKGEFVEV